MNTSTTELPHLTQRTDICWVGFNLSGLLSLSGDFNPHPLRLVCFLSEKSTYFSCSLSENRYIFAQHHTYFPLRRDWRLWLCADSVGCRRCHWILWLSLQHCCTKCDGQLILLNCHVLKLFLDKPANYRP